MDNKKSRNILLLVEGAKTEVKLFEKVLKCFPEIKINPENIITYNTSIWVLNDNLSRDFGDSWYLEDINFIEYLGTIYGEIKNKKITDVYLVFDYERQDSRFDSIVLENMQRFFNNSTENGQLYINYPMLESYRHITTLPDDSYKDRKCNCSQLLKYKSIVNEESKYTNLSKINKDKFKQIIIHNLKKASYILNNNYFLNDDDAWKFYSQIDFEQILQIQNKCSQGDNGFVHALCTCLLFVSEYNIDDN